MQEPELAARAGGEEGDATVYSRDGMCDSRRHVMNVRYITSEVGGADLSHHSCHCLSLSIPVHW